MRAGHRRGAWSPRRRGLLAAIPAVYFYNPLIESREAVRVGDGRLRDGVSEHRRKEFHVADAEGHACSRRAPSDGRAAAVASSTSLAEINVVPLVDVMLVLLIIFMVTAPMIQRGVDVNIAGVDAIGSDRQRADLRQHPARVSTPHHIVHLGDEPIRAEILQERVRQKMENRSDKGGATCAATAGVECRS